MSTFRRSPRTSNTNDHANDAAGMILWVAGTLFVLYLILFGVFIAIGKIAEWCITK